MPPSETIMPAASHGVLSLREKVARFVESGKVQGFIIAVILINAVVLGLYTSPSMRMHYGRVLDFLDTMALCIFVAELVLKLWGHGWRFFRSGWNVFDFVIITIALVPSSGALSVLRALRILRVLRLASMMPQLRFVVEALLRAIPGIISIAGLMLLLFYVSAVLATNLFGERFPDFFGTLPRALFSLFQVMTLDSWSSAITRPVMKEYSWAWIFFVPFVLLATFTMLNLFIAVIVNTMQTLDTHPAPAQNGDGNDGKALPTAGADMVDTVGTAEDKGSTALQIAALRDEIRQLRQLLLQGQARD